MGPAGIRRPQGRPARDRDRPPGEPRVPGAGCRGAQRPGLPGHAARHRLAHDDDQRPRRPRLGRRRDRGGGGDARRVRLDARPAGRRLPADRVHARGRDRHRPRPDGDADPPPDRRRREVRGVLRRRRLEPPARRPGDDREHVAGVRRDLRLLPRRPGDARLPAADGPPGGADRSGRGLLQGESPLARPRPRADLLAGRGARSRRRRAEPRRPAATAGPCAADGREALVPGRARELRRRLRERTRRSGRRVVPRERPGRRQHAGPQPRRPSRSDRSAGDRRCRARQARAGRARRPAVRPRARRGRDRGDHELHEHLEPERDDRGRARGQERRRARPPAASRG